MLTRRLIIPLALVGTSLSLALATSSSSGCVIDLTGGREGEGEGAAGEGEGVAGEGEGAAAGEGEGVAGEGEGAAGEGEGAAGEGEGTAGEGEGAAGEGEGEGEGEGGAAPVVAAPTNGDVEEACAPITLSCSAAGATLRWLDGANEIAQSGDASYTPNSAGVHTLTCEATSSGGVSSASVDVTVNAVHVQINHPGANDGPRTAGASFPLIAAACSASLGDIVDDADYVWSSDLDGALGTGKSLTVNGAGAPLSLGTHIITITASDGIGGSANATRQVVIQ